MNSALYIFQEGDNLEDEEVEEGGKEKPSTTGSLGMLHENNRSFEGYSLSQAHGGHV